VATGPSRFPQILHLVTTSSELKSSVCCPSMLQFALEINFFVQHSMLLALAVELNSTPDATKSRSPEAETLTRRLLGSLEPTATATPVSP
jgi:hypothetical protein